VNSEEKLKNLRRVSIVAKESNQRLSDLLGINDEYTAFCLNELGLMLATTWRNEDTYIEKIIKQNKGFMALADKLKPKEKN